MSSIKLSRQITPFTHLDQQDFDRLRGDDPFYFQIGSVEMGRFQVNIVFRNGSTREIRDEFQAAPKGWILGDTEHLLAVAKNPPGIILSLVAVSERSADESLFPCFTQRGDNGVDWSKKLHAVEEKEGHSWEGYGILTVRKDS